MITVNDGRPGGSESGRGQGGSLRLGQLSEVRIFQGENILAELALALSSPRNFLFESR